MSTCTDKVLFQGNTLLASSWLAQGRDVHYEKQQYRRLITSPRLPGYLEGTSMMPTKPKKIHEPKYDVTCNIETLFTSHITFCSSAPPKSDVALHLLPSRPTKAATKLAQSVRRSFDGYSLSQSALGGSLAWSKPRFSPLQDLKKLTNKPGQPPKSRLSQNAMRKKFNWSISFANLVTQALCYNGFLQ